MFHFPHGVALGKVRWISADLGGGIISLFIPEEKAPVYTPMDEKEEERERTGNGKVLTES